MTIKNLLDEAINDIFLKKQGEMGISEGDVDPLAQNKLDGITANLATIIEGILSTQRRTNALQFDGDGWHYISPGTGRRYDLLEGMGLGSPRNSTSDIIFIVDTEPETYAVVGYMMGASFFEGNDDDIQWIDGIVKEYESKL